jgi:lipoprotein-anchoring transpeptidase ErfK/SrfK
MHLLSEKVYARDLMSYGTTDFGARGCRARGPTLGAAMAMLTALVLGGCMQTTLNPVSDANFTARDKQQLTNPPYQQAWIPPAYQRQVVQYHRKEAPGSILVDTDGRYVYYVLPEGKAIRYGAIVGEDGQAWSGVATVGRKEEWPGWTPTESEKRRLGPLPNYVEGGARNPMGARALYLYAGGKDTLYRIHGTNQPGWIGHAISSGCIRLTNEDVIDLYGRVKVGAPVVVLGPKQGLSRVASAGSSQPN